MTGTTGFRVRECFSSLVILTIALTVAGHSQTLTVLQTFGGTNGNDPGSPILDRAGNIYGTTVQGGPGEFGGYGNVYKLARAGSGYVLDNLYNFTAHNDGAYPEGALTFGPDGVLYGTTSGGGSGGYGTIFKVTPPPTFCRSVTCPWSVSILYSFGEFNDGSGPYGNVVFDAAGNMYGTTYYGGQFNFGTVWKATRSGESWTESVIYNFDGPHGSFPTASVIVDGAGNLYGTTNAGGANGWGTVYELSPSGEGWTQQMLYSFQNHQDGRSPYGGVILDSAGNLYGSAQNNGQNLGGTIFELSPSGGSWTFNLLYSLSGRGGPAASLTFDSAGNLYGTTYADGVNNLGSVFELSPSNGGWVYTDLWDFAGGNDGKWPAASVALDANGNIFGTTSQGAIGYGNVFEITR